MSPSTPGQFSVDPELEIEPRELKRLLDAQEDLFLLDVRRHNEWEVARVAGAVLIPLHELPARVAELSGHESRRVIVYCHHGVRSLRAVEFLKTAGFAQARSLAGGIDLFSQLVDPTIPRYR